MCLDGGNRSARPGRTYWLVNVSSPRLHFEQSNCYCQAVVIINQFIHHFVSSYKNLVTIVEDTHFVARPLFWSVTQHNTLPTSSDSPNTCLLSECPRMTQVPPQFFTMPGLISSNETCITIGRRNKLNKLIKLILHSTDHKLVFRSYTTFNNKPLPTPPHPLPPSPSKILTCLSYFFPP